jgi:hypothetical protein
MVLLTHAALGVSIRTWLKRQPAPVLTLYGMISAFSLYTCVYAFRKPFAAATFEGHEFLGIGYKVWLVTAQVLGYAASKFAGIRFISELKSNQRPFAIIVSASLAGISWLFFAITPAPYSIVFLFMNGLPLGLVWGMIFSYLEGRSMTEVLGVGLSISFILSSGLTRSVGAGLIQYMGVPEEWMPFLAACLFAPPLLAFVFLLDLFPAPTERDMTLRTKRTPMMKSDRKRFLLLFAPGIFCFVIAYMLLTAYRDLRDNFSAEVLTHLGYTQSPGIYAATELIVSLFILAALGSLYLIKNSKTALIVNHVIIIAGLALVGSSTLLFHSGRLSPEVWMILIGCGLYAGYVPFNSIFFDRMLAAFQFTGTVGFIMYVADSFGYLGTVAVLFFKEFGGFQGSWLDFLIRSGYVLSAGGLLMMVLSLIYFHRKLAPDSGSRE